MDYPQPNGPDDGAVPEFSVIVTFYNEENNVDEFYGRLAAVLASLGRNCELVFVDDGSRDGTVEKLRRILEIDARVALVELEGNFGQWPAMAAGIAASTGLHFIFLDSDLEIQPEDLPRLMEVFDKGYDIVGGIRDCRVGLSLSRRILSITGNWVVHGILRIGTRDMGCGMKIIHSNIIRSRPWNPMRAFDPLPLLRRAKRTADVPVAYRRRKFGCSGWSLGKLFRCYWRSFISCYVPWKTYVRAAGLGAAALAAACLSALYSGPQPNRLLGGLAVVAAFSSVSFMTLDAIMRRIEAPLKHPSYKIRRESRHRGISCQ